MSRISWDEYFSEISKLAACRSTCPKAEVGAVVVKNNMIIGTGYNGAPHGMPHCTDIGCIEDRDNHCIRSVHAEENAIMQANRNDSTQDATIYTTHLPCIECSKAIIQAGISRVIFINDYYDGKSEILGYETQREFLEKAGTKVEKSPLS